MKDMPHPNGLQSKNSQNSKLSVKLWRLLVTILIIIILLLLKKYPLQIVKETRETTLPNLFTDVPQEDSLLSAHNGKYYWTPISSILQTDQTDLQNLKDTISQLDSKISSLENKDYIQSFYTYPHYTHYVTETNTVDVSTEAPIKNRENGTLYLDFNTLNLRNDSGILNTIQDISQNADVTFNTASLNTLFADQIKVNLPTNQIVAIDNNGYLTTTTINQQNYWQRDTDTSTLQPLNSNDNLTINGNTILGDSNTDIVTLQAQINSDIIPHVDNSFSLGSTDYRWRDLYVGPSSLHLGTAESDTVIVYDPDQSMFGIWINPDENPPQMIITPNGRIGIGTLNPSHLLHVAGSIRVEQGINANNGTVNIPSYHFYGDANTGMYHYGTDAIAFTTGGNTRLILNNDGQIIIGDPNQIDALTNDKSLFIENDIEIGRDIYTNLLPNSSVFTDADGKLTTDTPITGNLGYWSRLEDEALGYVLTPNNEADSISLGYDEYIRFEYMQPGGVLFTDDDGIVTQDASHLFWDETSYSLAIDLQDVPPQRKLHIGGTDEDPNAGTVRLEGTTPLVEFYTSSIADEGGSDINYDIILSDGALKIRNLSGITEGPIEGITFSTSQITINQDAQTLSFNVKSVNHPNALFVKSEYSESETSYDGFVGINTGSPKTFLHIYDGDSFLSTLTTNSLLFIEGDDTAGIQLAAQDIGSTFIAFGLAGGESGEEPFSGEIRYNNTLKEFQFTLDSQPTYTMNRLEFAPTGDNSVDLGNQYFSWGNIWTYNLNLREITPVGSDPVCWDGSGASAIGDCTSLAKFKTDVKDLDLGLETVMKMKPKTFNWIQGMSDGTRDIGFIAEELDAISPLLTTHHGPNGELSGVRYNKLTAVLTKAIQDQQQLIDDLSQQLELLIPISKINIYVKLLDRNLEFVKPVVFDKDVRFHARISYDDRDKAGFAIIKKGVQSVKVKFIKPYSSKPVITLTIEGGYAEYYLTDVSKYGFTINLTKAATKDLTFHWNAILVNNATTTYSGSSTSVSVTPTSTPTPMVTPTTPSPSPTVEAQNDQTVSGAETSTSTNDDNNSNDQSLSDSDNTSNSTPTPNTISPIPTPTPPIPTPTPSPTSIPTPETPTTTVTPTTSLPISDTSTPTATTSID